MRVLLTSTAAAAFLALSLPAAPAFAETVGDNCQWIDPPGFGGLNKYKLCTEYVVQEPECECVDDALDILQNLTAAQTATNRIDDFKTVRDVVQSAVNVGNSVSIENDLNEVPDMNSLIQHAGGYQKAYNYIEFGGGGYDAPDFVFDENTDELTSDYTQSALNAVNLINVPTLGAPVDQNNTTLQQAINTATFEGHTYGFSYNGDVHDLSQSATNVANSVSAAGFFTFDDCGCIEIDQWSSSTQLASNTISGASSYDFGLLQGAIQNATNIANSINGSMPDTGTDDDL